MRIGSKPGPEVFGIPFRGKMIIYAPLKRIAFVANRAMATLVRDLLDGRVPALPSPTASVAVELLRKAELLAPDPPLTPVQSPAEFTPTSATLFLTNRCNLRCVYCYADGGTLSPVDMPSSLALQAIDVVSRNAVKRCVPGFEVGFHGGGEPTLNWDVLTAAVSHARRQPLRGFVSMSSNGCYSAGKLSYILDNFDGLSLSFDGPPEVQNAQRPRATGTSSFRAVMKTIAEFDKRSFPYGLRVTAGRSTLDKLPDIVRFLARHTGAKRVQIEPVFRRGRGRPVAITAGHARAFVRGFCAALDVAAAHGLDLSYSGARPDLLTTRFCLSTCEALVVLQTGEVSTCFEVHNVRHPLARHFLVGRLQDGQIELDRRRWLRIANRTGDRIRFCSDCFCKFHCAGDCLGKTYCAGGVDRFRPSPRCVINQELTKHLLVRKMAQHHGMWLGQTSARIGDKP